MKLLVRLFAGLRERAGSDQLQLDELSDGLTLGELKREIERRHPALGSLAHVSGVVGTSYAHDARVLQAGEEVSLLPPVSGGASGTDSEPDYSQGVFELCRAALDAGRAIERVVHPTCGAIASFVGTTRESNRGARVLRLEYEAFEAMTGPEMARIFARARAQLSGKNGADGSSPVGASVRMLVQHRVGVVEVAAPSVVIATASAHRATAFEACRFLIDELKQTLPIWKKEIYTDGHHWIGERS